MYLILVYSNGPKCEFHFIIIKGGSYIVRWASHALVSKGGIHAQQCVNKCISIDEFEFRKEWNYEFMNFRGFQSFSIWNSHKTLAPFPDACIGCDVECWTAW